MTSTVVIGKRHTVERDNVQLLPLELKINVTVRRGVHDSPELLLAGIDRYGRPDFAVQGENSLRLPLFCSRPTVLGRDSNLPHKPSASVSVLTSYVSVAHHEHALAHPAEFRIVSVNAIDDDCPGHAVEILAGALAID